MMHDTYILGETLISFHDDTPRSLFSKSSKNGLWLYSPYLCGTGMVEMLNMSYDWGTKCWDRSGHINKPIDILERIISIFEDDIFHGGKRPTRKFFDSFKLSIDIKAQFLGDPDKLRRYRGGTHASEKGSIFRSKGRPDSHSRYTKQGKLFALGQADWLISRLDFSRFPSLASPLRNATEILDALKSDLTEDITGRTPVATLNYHLLLRTVSTIFGELDRVTRDMPLAKNLLAELREDGNAKEPGLQDKVVAMALYLPSVTLQDIRNGRLDSPILSCMGAHLSKLWAGMGPELKRTFIFGEKAGKIPDSVLAAVKPGARKNFAEGTHGGEFLRSQKMQELRRVSPEMYEMLVGATAGIEVGNCANCEHCRAGVKIENRDDLLEQLIKKITRD
ncbi:hypothetical protein MMC28_010679 [Mycoblastus sanguinarius]|nr:hypothetical protein [Mycoblastus sanguinarius]